jgi:2-oxo-4-hydroxy-4-carboxy-5-ureidoimidazoline decarboxylase
MSGKHSLSELNDMDAKSFVQLLGGVFEHSPWVAQGVVSQRPFATLAQLHAAMVSVIEGAGMQAQLRLIRAHPELAGKAALRGELTAESTREQSGAGLDQCSPEEFAALQGLNASYNTRFGFPFIVAVRGHTRQSIIALLGQRLANSVEAEQTECLQQIYRIGLLRLQDMLVSY